MKPLLLIPAVIIAVLGLSAICLSFAGIHVHAADPIAAGGVVIVASSLGILPILIRRNAELVETWQAALAGTVIHLLVTFAGAAILLTTGIAGWRGPFPFWLIAAYWISLFLLTKQLRQLALKVHPKC